MKRIQLGGSDLQVSTLCLGTMNYGWKEPEASSVERMAQFVEAGGNFIDTANVYSRREAPGKDFYGKDFAEYQDGSSERLIGKWVKEKGNRHELVIATKVGFAYPGIQIGTSPKQIREECEKSLKRLQTDYIDLLYLHMDDKTTPLEESLGALTELVQAGKVRHIGVSNFTTSRLMEAVETAARENLAPICCIQQRHTYLRPRPGCDFGRQVAADEELFTYLKTQNITALAYSPLLKGYYGNPQKELPEQYRWQDAEVKMAALKQVMEETGATGAQIVYGWMLQSSPVVLPIVAASTRAQFQEALGALTLNLTQEEMEKLNKK